MSEPIQAYPLQWPPGWRRMQSYQRTRAKFGKGRPRQGIEPGQWIPMDKLTVADGVARVLGELGRMGIRRDDIVVSTNVPTRLDGLPRGDARVPDDPGAAVYWRKAKQTRCMAIDRYDPCNLALGLLGDDLPGVDRMRAYLLRYERKRA